jgi:23S rRNA pseudouridine2605 synthase
MLRIQHFLSQAGICSRREGERLIENNRVRVNGIVLDQQGTTINPESDVVEFYSNGKWDVVKTDENLIYYALNKPAGVTVTTKDPHAKRVITDLLPKSPRVYPVGRLDEDSCGLIILTNDGNLAQKLTHPSNHIVKTYIATIKFGSSYDVSILPQSLSKIARGVIIDNYRTAPAKIRMIGTINHQNKTFINEVQISEGKNRQIRKMYQKIGLNVILLERIAIGNLKLRELNLKPGKFKIINQSIIEKVFN